MSGKTFTFTVDGLEIVASPGQTIIQACDAAGIYIPRLSLTRISSRPAIAGFARARSMAVAAASAPCRRRTARWWRAIRRS